MQKSNEELIYVDVGSRWGINKRINGEKKYDFETFFNEVKYIGFEPDIQEYNKLKSQKQANEIYYPYALGIDNKKRPERFYICKSPDWSSFYIPLKDKCDDFCTIRDDARVERFIELSKRRLDDIITDVDFLKVDTEGSERDVLFGSGWLLDDKVLGVEVETYFSVMREKHHLFDSIHSIMTRKGFLLFDLDKRKYYRNASLMKGKGQMLFGDAIYLKDYKYLTSEKKKEKLVFISMCLGFLDYALTVANDCENWWIKDEVKKYIKEYDDPSYERKNLHPEYIYWRD